ncbi:hypothetical protein ACM26V_24650 [Salipaludibacillus sp. HK11]|uniref:hypothetical protein n=1 Tax=Salipaludibacillus sp. HK11 TaxID=3394320 RepID=UPI0039FD8CA0
MNAQEAKELTEEGKDVGFETAIEMICLAIREEALKGNESLIKGQFDYLSFKDNYKVLDLYFEGEKTIDQYLEYFFRAGFEIVIDHDSNVIKAIEISWKDEK